jgi:hypothetical protein
MRTILSAGFLLMTSPSKVMVPSLGLINPLTVLKRLDLPAPGVPSISTARSPIATQPAWCAGISLPSMQADR